LIRTAGSGYILKYYARSDGSTNAVAFASSAPFDVSVGEPFLLGMKTLVGTATGGSPFSPNPVLAVTDRGGNVVSSVNGYRVVAVLDQNSYGAQLLPVTGLTVLMINGVAAFQQMYINPAGNYFITFTINMV